MIKEVSVISWNIRGLGRHKKCTDVKATLSSAPCSLLCLQESKLQDISNFKAISFLPPNLRNFHFMPAIRSAGGILTAWDDNFLSCYKVLADTFAITCWFEYRARMTSRLPLLTSTALVTMPLNLPSCNPW